MRESQPFTDAPAEAVDRAQALIGFARDAGVTLEARVGVIAGADPMEALALEMAAPGGRLLIGPRAAAGLREGAGEDDGLRTRYDDERTVPADTHAFGRLVVLAGALGGPVGLVGRLGEIRRLLRPDGTMILDSGVLARGQAGGRLELEQLQRALAIVGLAVTKIRLETPVTPIAIADHRVPLSVLAVERALILASPLG